MHLEIVVNIGVVDQALLADAGSGLLEVSAHNDKQVIPMLLFLFKQKIAILERSYRVMDRTGSDDNEEALSRVFALHHSGYLLA